MNCLRNNNLGDILLELGELTAEQLACAVERQRTSRMRLGAACLAEGLITEASLARALAQQCGLEHVDLKGFQPDEALLASVPPEIMHRYRFVPMEERGDHLVVAIADPTAVLEMDDIELFFERPIIFKVAAESDVNYHLKRGDSTRRVLQEVAEDFKVQLVTETERGEEVLSVENVTADPSPIIKLINSTLLEALSRHASDVHIETVQEGVVIKYRIDGVLYSATEPIDHHFQGPLISRLKVMSELDISERRVPQDGRFKVRIGPKSVDFRVSIMPSAFGEDAVIRVLDKDNIASGSQKLSLQTLGMEEGEANRFRKFIQEPYGMVLVTGPTGSGKTTTLYGAISEIHTGHEKIITIEDPVEYVLDGVTQIPVNEKKGLTFARGLRSVLRHDPDKIMIGEIRDPETAQIAVQSALTGHLVFTTVHANNVFDVIGRFAHMGIDPYNFVSSLNCVMAQRLVRKLCPACKRQVFVDDAALLESGISPLQARGRILYEAQGCQECGGTGYRSRCAIVELLGLNDEIRELIVAKAPVAVLRKAALAAGTTFLREAAVAKVLNGETSLKEINRITFVEPFPGAPGGGAPVA